MVCRILKSICNHHSYLFSASFYHPPPPRNPYSAINPHFLLPPLFWFLSLDFAYSGPYLVFYDWLLSFSLMFSKFIHILAFTGTLLLSMAESCPTVWICYICLPVHQLVDIWDVSTFCLFETHHCEHSRTFLCWHMFTFLVCISLRVELVGHMVTLYITFWGTAKLFSKQWRCFPFLLSTYEGSDCSTSSPFPVTYCLSVRFSSLSGCDVVSHCGFDLHIFP